MSHEHYMRRCLDLASLAWPSCRPNPMVGAVLVYKDKIISEGYTQAYGGAHAEVECLRAVTDEALLRQSTLYVSLEPCAHHGKTPPCADLIIRKGVGRVVIGASDPHEEVKGKGAARLEAAGIEVIEGVLENDCRYLNRRFMTFHEKGRPYVVLKWAETADGFIDSDRTSSEPALTITTLLANQISHQRRASEMGILVGGNTWRMDLPTLNVRHLIGVNPERLIWSAQLRNVKGATVIKADNVRLLLEEIASKGIQSILVEGGAEVLQQFIDAELADEVVVLRGEMTIGRGKQAPIL